jgi:hypothetical protein
VLDAAMMVKARSIVGTSDLKAIAQDLRRWVLFTWNLYRRYPEFVAPFWSCVRACLVRKPGSLKVALLMIAMYTHLGRFAQKAVHQAEAAIEGMTDVAASDQPAAAAQA